jgi:hypothetical protein
VTVEMQGDAGLLAGVRHRVGGLGCAAHQHQVDPLVDQLPGDLAGAHRVGLAVLDQDLQRVGPAADLQAVLEPLPDGVDDEAVGVAEGEQRSALRGHEAELDRLPVGQRVGGGAAGQQRGAGQGGELDEPPAVHARRGGAGRQRGGRRSRNTGMNRL